MIFLGLIVQFSHSTPAEHYFFSDYDHPTVPEHRES